MPVRYWTIILINKSIHAHAAREDTLNISLHMRRVVGLDLTPQLAYDDDW